MRTSVTIPNVNIGDCDYTIAFWMRSYGGAGILGSSRSGKHLILYIYGVYASFCHEVSTGILIDTAMCVHSSLDVVMNNWIHIAATCEQDNKVKIFFNGKIVNITIPPPSFGIFTIRPPKNAFVTFGYPLSPVIMDLHILGFALPRDEIYDLFRG